MAIGQTVTKIQEQGNGAKSVFEFPFAIYEQSDIAVYRVNRATGGLLLQTIGEDYTVSFVKGKENTGSVSYIKYDPDTASYIPYPIEADKDSFIISDFDIIQPVALPVNSRFREDQIEGMGDRIVRMVQQLAEQVSRTIQASMLENGVPITWDNLVEAVSRAEEAADRAEAVAGFELASRVEAEAGIENTKFMSPLRTKQAIDVLVPIDDVTIERVDGILRVKDGSIIAAKIGAGAVVESKIGTGAVVEAKIGAGAVTVDKIGSAAVSQAKLKTASGEVSNATTTLTLYTLPGGEYGFYPQVKADAASDSVTASIKEIGVTLGNTYVTAIALKSAISRTIYAKQRYVTASGEDHWIFLLLDKETKEIIGGYQAPDHPAYGNGGDFDEVPHPFGSYDETIHEIVLVDNDTIAELKSKVTHKKSLLTLVNEEYEPDMSKEEKYKPLHSGKYLKEDKDGKEVQIKELVTKLPDYIKVRKLRRK